MKSFVLVRWSLLLCLTCGYVATAQDAKPLDVQLRYRSAIAEGSAFYHTLHRGEQWVPSETALIICDMWDLHHCRNAVLREAEIAPRLNEVASSLRDRGVTIIHAPSSCMNFYKEHQARKRAIDAPQAKHYPKDIHAWCHEIPEEKKGVYPIDQSDGGEDDDSVEHAVWAKSLEDRGLNPRSPWTRQIDVISIDPQRDYISDSGKEIWNVLEQQGVKNVILSGVHTNMCVLGRPFGLRQMVRGGKNVALLRDLTDTMYNPAMRPFVSHFTGTDLIIEHIEKWVCPTITSNQFAGDEPIRFSKDTRPRIVMLVAEREYKTDQSLAQYAIDRLGKEYRVSFVYADAEDRNYLPGLEVIEQADLLLVSVRRRTLKPEQLKLVKDYVAAGKPVVGIRTASHAFCLRGKEAPKTYAQWESFDAEVFGGNYENHHGNALETHASFANITHSVLSSIKRRGFISGGSLYRVRPLAKGTTVLMNGKVEGAPTEPIAWTFRRADGGRSFYTSLGHVDDFEQPLFREVLAGGIRWALNN